MLDDLPEIMDSLLSPENQWLEAESVPIENRFLGTC